MTRKAIAAIALAAAFCAAAADIEVRSAGTGGTYRSAVGEALLAAVEQHRGGTVSTVDKARVVSSANSVAARDNGVPDEHRKLEIKDEVERNVKTVAGGSYLGYTVLSERYDTARGEHRVEVSVKFAGPYVVGLDPANRRRMAVVPFRAVRPKYAWMGQEAPAATWAETLAAKLNVCLTQTRKFTMLERKFDAEVAAELALLSGPNASPRDAVRLNQKLGTDYLVTGEVTLSNVEPPPVNPYTGRAMPPASALFAEVTYRVILAPTGQLKWTDTVKLDAASFMSGDYAAFVSKTAEAAACMISDGMMSNILPFEIVGRTASGQLVVGEGGKSLKAGECFTVFALGEEVRDSRTGEVLDVIEDAVGTVQIVRVTEKLSYAVAVEGDAAKMAAGSRLRRVPLGAQGGAAAPAEAGGPATQAVKTQSGGVVLPF